jgi:hypothetical protein
MTGERDALAGNCDGFSAHRNHQTFVVEQLLSSRLRIVLSAARGERDEGRVHS